MAAQARLLRLGLLGAGSILAAAVGAQTLLPPPSAPTPEQVAARARMMARVGAEIGAAKAKPTPHMPDGKPNLNGLWMPPGDFFMRGEKTGSDVIVHTGGEYVGGRRPMPADGPKYKPELVSKVDYNDINEPKTDNVFLCGRAGTPRIGAPHQIIQTPNEVVFLYSEVSGESFRVIPTDGRTYRDEVDASLDGDAIGHWEGDTLVVDTKNFVEETWFGERGYFHTDQMTVRETLKREGDSLVWQATVTDPAVLIEPYRAPPRTVLITQKRLEEPPPCGDIVADHLVNMDNHQQR